MSGPSNDRVREVFVDVCDLPTGEREQAVDDACGDDTRLRSRVLALLALDADGGGALSDDAVDAGVVFRTTAALGADGKAEHGEANGAGRAADGADGADDVPTTIGRYRIIRKIGDGGMGTVYEAEQRDPQRTVALKLLRRGMTSRSMLRRFRSESQILGRLQHPGIAQIFEADVRDAGGAGEPYFAMEYVDGVPLGRFVVERDLALRDRLRLFIRVCEAVSYAHQKGVVHRDLKPDNILVVDDGGTGRPKVLDFGIAKVIEADMKVTTIETNVGQLVGTIPYMSPEQVEGDSTQIDARSDVYALGVLMYELLTGRLPHDFEGCSLPEAVRVIRERPHGRLSSVDRTLRGDLETIVGTALEKDVDRRYQSVSDLAADLRHYLADEPIAARPPSTFYQLSKFAKRNKPLVAGIAIAFVALVAGVIAAGAFALEASARERAARWSTYKARVDAAWAAIERADVDEARRLLDDAPPEHRGWEWAFLHRSLVPWDFDIDAGGEIVDEAWFVGAGDTVAAGLADGSVGVWRLATGARVTTVETGVEAVACAGDAQGALAAVGGIDGSVTLIDLDAGEVIARWSGAEDASGAREWSEVPDGPGTDDDPEPTGDADAPDASDASDESGDEPPAELPPGAVDALAVAPDATRVAVVIDGVLTLRDRVSGDTLWSHRPTRGRRSDWAVWFSRDGSRVLATYAVWHRRRGARLLDARTGELIEGYGETERGAALDAAGGRVATATLARDIVVRDLAGDDLTLTGHAANVNRIVFATDDMHLASKATDGAVRVHELRGGRVISTLRAPSASRGLGIDATGRHLVTTLGSRLIGWLLPSAPSRRLVGHDSYVYSVAFSSDGTMLASGQFLGRRVLLWDPIAVTRLAEVRAPSRPLWLTFVEGDGRLAQRGMAAASLIDTATAAVVRQVDEEGTSFGGLVSERAGRRDRANVVHSPDGSMLAAVRFDRGRPTENLEIIDATTGVVRFGLTTPQPTLGVAFSPDGRTVAAAQIDGVVSLWDTTDGALRSAGAIADTRLYFVEYSPDGSRLAVAGNDGRVYLVHAETLERLLQLRGHESYVYALAFSPDGTQLASASGDQTVRLWDTVPKSERRAQAFADAARRAEVAPYVRRLLDEFGASGGRGDAAPVAAAIRADASLDADRRRAALRVLLAARGAEDATRDRPDLSSSP